MTVNALWQTKSRSSPGWEGPHTTFCCWVVFHHTDRLQFAYSSFRSLCVTNKAATNAQVQIFVWLYASFLLGYPTEVTWLDREIKVSLFSNLQHCFPSRLYHFPLPPAVADLLADTLYCHTSNRHMLAPCCGFLSYFLNTCDLWSVLLCLCQSHLSFFTKYLSKSPSHFKN